MKRKLFMLLIIFICPMAVIAADSIYCPQKQGYIKVGMSATQVIGACGEPMTKQESDTPATVRVPVTQLYYTTPSGDNPVVNNFRPIFETWSLPQGTQSVMLEIDIINDKVSDIRINSEDNNALSFCDGQSIAIGDDAIKVYQSCGTPQVTNQSFIEQPIPSNSDPEIWIYQIDPFQPPVSLTIIDGKLQSIN